MAGKERGFDTLTQFLTRLEREGELHRITTEVDPYLEVSQIACRALLEGQKALLFENVKGSRFPLAMNFLASNRRVEIALATDPTQLGNEILHVAEQLMPPKPRTIWRAARPLLSRLLASRVRRTSPDEPRPFFDKVDLNALPILQTWPEDDGKFITLPEVFTYDPGTGKRNVGMYRMQLFDAASTGMHWQIQKGGGFHYTVAEKLGQPLEVAVAIGTDPALLMAAVAPLPEGLDEVLFAGFLRGHPTSMTRAKSISIDVPTYAEFILEGIVPPQERRLEGPFGDHFGHYSHAGQFPVFHIRAITHLAKPVFAATVVGKPPMEDKWLGDTTQQILGPLIRLNHPEVKSVWAFYEAGFHNLLGVASEPRYAREATKTALSLLGEGQLSLTKCAVVINPDVNNRDFRALLRAIRDNFDPHYDLLLIPNTAMDTLDFTSYQMNLGSKMVIDATRKQGATASGGKYPERGVNAFYARTGRASEDVKHIDLRIREWKVFEDVLLVVKLETLGNANGVAGREVIQKFIADSNIEKLPRGVKMIAAVSEDVDLSSDMEVIWGIFTRFDAARDISFTRTTLAGATAVNEGIMGIDATWKPGYPNPCVMPEDVVNRVDSRWSEFGFR
ncbi:MAG: UbiD family decarboxylase [Bacteroidota bacterium]|nr:UbiD family decarboxylase [Bacteroidota bacterium]MDP4234372.1 UbiD family decarboxylase [Bacteroidota bacterium]MDP4243305.1 UbiD family decarboxylase [Bacteroidota bacterium]MDP4287990.1 UbiD family decarboxylase [Bacteroidota bacterium]